MKKIFILALVPFAMCATGCQRSCCDTENVVCETYVHKYGIEVPADDWASRGESGQVISVLSNGVKITRNYANGNLHGETTYSFPHSDTLEKIELYDQGTLAREIFNNTLGSPKREVQHFSPTHYSLTVWYENGSPHSEEEYEGKYLLNGDYFTLNHQLESRVEDREGVRTCRDSYGQLLTTETIAKGERVLEVTYYPNGSPKAKTPYCKGLIDGQLQAFLPSGEPSTTESWVAGVQHGITVLYRNGEKYAEVPYTNGMKDGIEKRYRDGKTVVEEISWSQNKRHGLTKAYIENMVTTDWYFKDKAVTQSVFEQMSRPAR